MKMSGYMYKFQDLTPISGHFRTNFKISGQRPSLILYFPHYLYTMAGKCPTVRGEGGMPYPSVGKCPTLRGEMYYPACWNVLPSSGMLGVCPSPYGEMSGTLLTYIWLHGLVCLTWEDVDFRSRCVPEHNTNSEPFIGASTTPCLRKKTDPPPGTFSNKYNNPGSIGTSFGTEKCHIIRT